MVFANLFFLYIFLPVNLILYYATRSYAVRNFVLVAMSFLFYAWGEPVWVLLLLASGFMVWFCSLLVERFAGTRRGKAALIFAVTISLSLLGIFKYSGFLIENINAVLPLSLPVPQFSLPIGISFYTFQMISYIVDVYRGDVKAQPSFLRFIMYVSMYFQLVAGPIVRYSDVAWEIGHRTANANDISHGITRFCIGLLKKVAVANVAGSLLVQYMDGDLTKVTVLGSWFGAVLFMLQIYYDFSGYSDMAIGLGLMFGFHFVENFNYPYIAKTATEFWRRWHISLSSFLRDYLYIPLGGNRSHAWRNLFVVWFATGLWHGASWNFILWGLFFGVLIALERLGLRNLLEKLPGFISHFYLLFAVLISWVIFYFTDLSRAAQYLGIMFGLSGQPLTNSQTLLALEGNLFWLILAVVFCLPLARIASQQITAAAAVSRPRQIILGILVPVMNLGILLICTAMLSGQSYNPFLYYRF
ncbi:MBOAT family protein [Hydrogenoanaerobacterium saccharovorans]|uniref:MBOAT family protein n=1 Tax=Hydrogenoanaerobacterium saccharovorans TaxID=474960 RepID=A0ABS2GNF2_9FIRM|nr:MBOAT family O-acyltransferase [Hydrogenoanaerobacterium saccharovorans]MBM6923648.1 MBOAT family protein [Hydrogenoanaerobacterium saccharovorans]